MSAARTRLVEHGLASLSMRTLADDLGVTPMALYRHVEDRDDLLAAVIDHAIDEMGVLPADAEPSALLRELERRFRTAFDRLPDVALLLLARGPRTERSIEFIEQVVTALVDAGMDPADAATAYATVSQLALARLAAPSEITGAPGAAPATPAARAALAGLTRSDASAVDAILTTARSLPGP